MSEERILSTSEAREEIERGLRTFRAFEGLHNALKNLESLEQNLIETGARVNAMKAAEGELLKLKNDAQSVLSEATSKAGGIRRVADEDAKNIASDARAQASKVLGDAKEEAKKIKAAAQGELDALLQKVSELKGSHNSLDASLKQKKSELESVANTLAEHRATLEKFLKGA